MDAIDRRILALLVDDGRRTLDDVGGARRRSARRPSSAASTACARRARCAASPRSSTTTRSGGATQALIELFFAPGVSLDEVTETLGRAPRGRRGVVASRGSADAIARVRTRDNADLERLIRDLQRDGRVVRTRSQVVLSALVER